MKKHLAQLFTVGLLAALAVSASYQAGAEEEKPPAITPEKKPVQYPFRGKIGKVDPEEKTIGIAGRERLRIIHITAETRIMKDGKPAKLDDAAVGEEVAGAAKRVEGGREEAVSLRLGPRPEPAPRGTPRRPES